MSGGGSSGGGGGPKLTRAQVEMARDTTAVGSFMHALATDWLTLMDELAKANDPTWRKSGGG